jgi:hypothetical protein
MNESRPNHHADDPDPLTEPEQLPADDDLGELAQAHRGPSEAATAGIEERLKPQRGADPGRAPKDAPDY